MEYAHDHVVPILRGTLEVVDILFRGQNYPSLASWLTCRRGAHIDYFISKKGGIAEVFFVDVFLYMFEFNGMAHEEVDRGCRDNGIYGNYLLYITTE